MQTHSSIRYIFLHNFSIICKSTNTTKCFRIKLLEKSLNLCNSSIERASEATTETSRNNECPKLKCEVCPHGYNKDQQGCQTCDCIQGKNIETL